MNFLCKTLQHEPLNTCRVGWCTCVQFDSLCTHVQACTVRQCTHVCHTSAAEFLLTYFTQQSQKISDPYKGDSQWCHLARGNTVMMLGGAEIAIIGHGRPNHPRNLQSPFSYQLFVLCQYLEVVCDLRIKVFLLLCSCIYKTTWSFQPNDDDANTWIMDYHLL